MFSLEQYEIYSEKYATRGIVNYVATLNKAAVEFLYDKTYYNRAIEQEWPEGDEDAIKALGMEVMETYLAKILAGEIEVEKVRLYNWYVEKVDKHGKEYIRACGNVTGHYRFWDSQFIHTSEIESIHVDEENKEVVVCTCNTRYYCLLDSWEFEEQDKYPESFPNYVEWKEKYANKQSDEPIEEGKVLLSIANYDSYYFHSIYYRPIGEEKMKIEHYPHVGTFQDSFIIVSEDGCRINIRYFPHSGNIEFYGEITDGRPWYLENVGTTVLYARTSVGIIKLQPGDCKEVKKENAEEESVDLPGGDLYPAQML